MKIVTFEYDSDVQVGIISEDGKMIHAPEAGQQVQQYV